MLAPFIYLIHQDFWILTLAAQPSTEEWYYHSYQVKNKNVHLTIAEPEAVVELPPAEVSYTAGGNAVSTVSTDAVPLVIGVPFPKGSLYAFLLATVAYTTVWFLTSPPPIHLSLNAATSLP
jgi:hypothetical protein